MRVTRTDDGGLAVGRSLPGRGAWLHPDPACLGAAVRRRAFTRALRAPVRDGAAAALATALTRAGLEVQHRDGDVLVVPGATPDRIGALAAAGGHVLVDLRPSEQGLEDLFFQLTTAS